MKKSVMKVNGKEVSSNVETAYSFFRRFKGLMFRKSIEDDFVLHIKPCNQIHMLNMRFAIDVVYLSADGKVVKADEDVKPGAICKTVKGAKSVAEMKSGAVKHFGINKGDTVEIIGCK